MLLYLLLLLLLLLLFIHLFTCLFFSSFLFIYLSFAVLQSSRQLSYFVLLRSWLFLEEEKIVFCCGKTETFI